MIKLKLARLRHQRMIPGVGDRQVFEGPGLTLLPCGWIHVGDGRLIPASEFTEAIMEPPEETDGAVPAQVRGPSRGRAGRAPGT